MAAQFIGLHMRVVLREPPGQQVTGTVREVEAGLGLTLTNVFIVSTKEWFPTMRIGALNIADLSEIKDDAPPPSNYAAPPAEPITAPAPAYVQLPLQPPQPLPHPPAFIDPAILSLGKRPKSISSGNQSASDRNIAGPDPKVSRPGNLYAGLAVRQLEKEVEEDDEEDEEEEEEEDQHTVILESLKNVTIEERRVKNGNGGAETGREPRVIKKKPRTRVTKTQRERRVPNITTTQTAETGHGKGWRQTPILQSTAAFQPFNSLKRMSKKGKSSLDNGWASEDVTEEMGEFDFANNLAKFDKRTIFDQMRKEDQVDESSRLVSHNRRAKPGTAGGKNLHYTENVLDLPSGAGGADFWNSEADVNVNGAEKLSGRESSARRGGDGKPAASRRSQSAKTGPAVGSQPLSRVNSSVRYQASQRSSPGVGHRSTDYEQQQQQQQGRQESGLYLYPSMRRLETISSLQMLNVENIAANEVGFSEILMAENAGRGIAEVAVTALSDPAIKVRFQMVGSGSGSGPAGGDATLNSSTIVILAGNNKSSIRALAAGRHLRNRSFNVVVCLVGIERERDLLEDLRRQIQLYRNFGGKVLNKNDFFEWLRRNSESAAGLSTSLIIDALLGLTMSFEELRIGDQASVYELMEWANRNEAFVLAVDVPSGIDPTSGKIAIIDGGHLFIKPRYVVAIGAPKRGLLEAVAPPSPGEDEQASPTGTHEDEWRLFIADLGLGSAVWRKSGTRIRRGVEFEGKWVLEMRYRGPDKDSESE